MVFNDASPASENAVPNHLLREPIKVYLGVLLLIAVACLVAIVALFAEMGDDLEEYTRLQTHHNTISQVSLISQKNLLRVQNGFEALFLASSEAELDTAAAAIRESMDVLRQASQFFEQGGTFTETFGVNFDGLDKVLHTFRLDAPPGGKSLSAIEMRSSLNLLGQALDEYYGFNLRRLGQADQALVQSPDVLLMHKKVNPFFVRALEHSNRLYVQSMRDLQAASGRRQQQLQYHNTALWGFSFAALTLLLFTGALVFRAANRILAERAFQARESSSANAKLRAEAEDRIRAQAALARSERKLRDLYELAPIGIFTSTPEGRYLAANKALAKIYGYDSPEELLTQVAHIADHVYVSPEERTALRDTLERQGEVTNQEVRRKTKSGQIIWVTLSIRAVAGADGTTTHYEGFCVDITRRKQAELAERESQAELRKLSAAVEQSPATIVITDAQGIIQYVNPSFTQLTGYHPNESLGQTPRVLKSGLHPPEFFTAMWQTLLANTTWRGELCNRKKSGELYWEYASISPITDPSGAITNFVAVKEDITERMRREMELNRAISELETIFNASAVGIAYVDAASDVVRVNTRFVEMFGYAAADLLDQGLGVLFPAPDRLQAWMQEQRRALASGELVKAEWQLRDRSGRGLWCSIAIRVLDSMEKGVGSIWVFDDVTTRIDLETMRADVERIMRHDLKAPLNGIINFPTLVAQSGPLNTTQEEFLSLIRDAGRRMLAQIDLSLDLYRMESGTYEPKLHAVDLLHVAEGVCHVLAPSMRERLVRVHLLVEGHPIQTGDQILARANELLCHNTLLNLLKNAVEASPVGGCVTVDLAAQEGWVSVALHNEGRVPEEIQSVFFEKYSTAGKAGGTGLGTYSARIMTESQGGRIRFTSLPGQGVTITLELPAQER